MCERHLVICIIGQKQIEHGKGDALLIESLEVLKARISPCSDTSGAVTIASKGVKSLKRVQCCG
jgi:hypothetical protein